MAQTKSNSRGTANADDEVKPSATFHDFLGKGYPQDKSQAVAGAVLPPKVASPSASASSGGGRGPISTTSDLGSAERNVDNHFDGVPYYAPRGYLKGPETSNRYTGTKRSTSDSIMGSSRDKFPPAPPNLSESSQLIKLIKNAGGERPRRPHNVESSFGVHPFRPVSASLASQHSIGGRNELNASRWDHALPKSTGSMLLYPPRAGHALPHGYQAPTSRFRNTNIGPLVASQAAADEGSRTGMKGSGILNSINPSSGASERIPSGMLLSYSKNKPASPITEPESSNSPGRSGLASSSRQMTIFYGGQAHVFDDVHPDKADAIMAMAGSNGGSWSTTYAPKTSSRLENSMPRGENEAGMSSGLAYAKELHGRPAVQVNPSRRFGSDDRIPARSGVQRDDIEAKEVQTAAQATEPSAK